jgi:hypothetical protein
MAKKREMLRLTASAVRMSLARICRRSEATLVMHQAGINPSAAEPMAFIVPVSMVPRLKPADFRRELKVATTKPKPLVALHKKERGKRTAPPAKARKAEVLARRLIRYHRSRPTPKRTLTRKPVSKKKAAPSQMPKPEAA